MEEDVSKKIINQLCEEGKKCILPEKINNWTNYVISTKGNMQSLHEVSVALNIIALLDNGYDMDLVIEQFNNKECPLRDIIIRSLVANYSIRGPEFFEKTACEPLPKKNIEYLEKLKRNNTRLLFIHSMRDAGYDVSHTENGPIIVNGDFNSLFEEPTLKREKTSD